MNAFSTITAIALGLSLLNAWQAPALERYRAREQAGAFESKAVTRVQQTPASQYDPALPDRPLGKWFGQVVGPQSGVTWHLTECVEGADEMFDYEREVPACVEAIAVLPNQRKIVTQFLVGSFKQGWSGKTAFHFALIEEDDQLHVLQKLSDLPQMLQMPFPRIRLKAPVAPGENLRKNLNPPRFVTRTPPLNEPLGVKPADRESAPLQPKPGEKARISKGVSQGAVITRVTPIYPSTAKQMNAFGEVRVEITIDESGRVIEARALSGHPTLRGAAEEAARKWVFKPTLLDGTPVKQSGVLTFVFARPQ